MGREVRGDVGREMAKLFLVGGIGQGEIKFWAPIISSRNLHLKSYLRGLW